MQKGFLIFKKKNEYARCYSFSLTTPIRINFPTLSSSKSEFTVPGNFEVNTTLWTFPEKEKTQSGLPSLGSQNNSSICFGKYIQHLIP